MTNKPPIKSVQQLRDIMIGQCHACDKIGARDTVEVYALDLSRVLHDHKNGCEDFKRDMSKMIAETFFDGLLDDRLTAAALCVQLRAVVNGSAECVASPSVRRLCQEAIDMLFKQGAEIRRMTR